MGIVRNATLAKLRSGQLAIGLSVSLIRDAGIARIARTAGYDWLAIDMEHGAMSLSDASQICVAALPAGITPIARVKSDALHEAARILDCGAQGVLIPNVSTAREARLVVDACRYAPIGRRSWGSGTAHADGPMPPVVEALAMLNDEILIAAMIETPEGLANIGEIASVPGIDVLFVGALDLSIALGKPGKLADPGFWEALEAVAAACRMSGCTMGVGGLYEEASATRLLGLGARLVAGGGDQGFLSAAASARARFLSGLPIPAV